jgi:hypothetical protein
MPEIALLSAAAAWVKMRQSQKGKPAEWLIRQQLTEQLIALRRRVSP